MSRPHTTAEQILNVVRTHPDCTLEELTHYLEALTWSDLFLEVDRLSRSGHLLLTHSDSGLTTTIRAR